MSGIWIGDVEDMYLGYGWMHSVDLHMHGLMI